MCWRNKVGGCAASYKDVAEDATSGKLNESKKKLQKASETNSLEV